jgi:hypothetical protein
MAGTVNDSYLAAGANETVLRFNGNSITNCSFCLFEYVLPIFGMDKLSNCF